MRIATILPAALFAAPAAWAQDGVQPAPSLRNNEMKTALEGCKPAQP